jgi:hypothetical protein
VKNNNINGLLPSEMGALTLLRKFKTYVDDDQVKPGTYSRFIVFSLLFLAGNFDVSKNEITGTIPSSYGNMGSLGTFVFLTTKSAMHHFIFTCFLTFVSNCSGTRINVSIREFHNWNDTNIIESTF